MMSRTDRGDMFSKVYGRDVTAGKNDPYIILSIDNSNLQHRDVIADSDTELEVLVESLGEDRWKFTVYCMPPNDPDSLKTLLNVVRYYTDQTLFDPENWVRKHRVQSDSTDDYYEVVEYVGGFWTCSCNGFKYTKHCKHIQALDID